MSLTFNQTLITLPLLVSSSIICNGNRKNLSISLKSGSREPILLRLPSSQVAFKKPNIISPFQCCSYSHIQNQHCSLHLVRHQLPPEASLSNLSTENFPTSLL